MTLVFIWGERVVLSFCHRVLNWSKLNLVRCWNIWVCWTWLSYLVTEQLFKGDNLIFGDFVEEKNKQKKSWIVGLCSGFWETNSVSFGVVIVTISLNSLVPFLMTMTSFRVIEAWSSGTFVMVDDVRDTIISKSCRYGRYGLFERLRLMWTK